MAAKKTSERAPKTRASTEKKRREALAVADKNLKAIAVADQDNAKARDERAASPDGRMASERAMARAAKPKKTPTTPTTPTTATIPTPATTTTLARAAKGRRRAATTPTAAKAATRAAVGAVGAEGDAGGRSARRTDQGKASRPAGAASPKRPSALDAAAQVLRDRGAPMRAKEIMDAIVARRLWASPAGKTPHATLYSAMIREIGAKGKQSRFRRAAPGQFASAAAPVKAERGRGEGSRGQARTTTGGKARGAGGGRGGRGGRA